VQLVMARLELTHRGARHAGLIGEFFLVPAEKASGGAALGRFERGQRVTSHVVSTLLIKINQFG